MISFQDLILYSFLALTIVKQRDEGFCLYCEGISQYAVKSGYRNTRNYILTTGVREMVFDSNNALTCLDGIS